jgi:hypothetical protein
MEGVLQLWFSCKLFVLAKCSPKMSAPWKVCPKEANMVRWLVGWLFNDIAWAIWYTLCVCVCVCVCARAQVHMCVSFVGGQKSINSWMPIIGSVLCICRCGWASWSACSNTTGSTSFNHLIPLMYTLLWQTVLFVLDSQLLVTFCLWHSYSTLHILSCLYIMFSCHERTADEPNLQVLVWSSATVWPGLCSRTSHAMKLFQFFKYFLNLPYIISIYIINNKGT